MADFNQKITDLINNDVPILDETIHLSSGQLLDLIKSTSTINDIQTYHNNFEKFLYDMTGVSFFWQPYQFLTFSLTDSFDYKLAISLSGFKFIINRMLNLEATISEETEILNKIEELRSIKSDVDLKEKFPFYYEVVYKPQRDKSLEMKGFTISYMATRNNPTAFKKTKKMYGLNRATDSTVDTLYNTIRMYSKFDVFINNSAVYFTKIIENLEDVKKWIDENPINLKVESNDAKKVLLYVLSLHDMTLYMNAIQGNKYASQREFTALEDLLKKYQKLYPNDNTEIVVKSYDFKSRHLKETFTIDRIMADFKKVLEEYPYLIQNIKLPEKKEELSVDEYREELENFFANAVEDTINEDAGQGAINAEEEVKQKLEKLEEEVKSKTLSDKEKDEKAIVIAKLKMVLNDIEPRAIQTGIGVFNGYYVYYYNSGMVAVDKVDGYGALYIMPVNIYNLAKYKKRLKDVRQIPGVEYVNHKNREWLSIAREHIMSGTGNLTEQDKKDAELIASIDFPYTAEEIEKLQKQLEEKGNFTEGVAKETKRRLIKIKELKDIDKELTNNEFNNYSDSSEEKRQALEQLDEGQDEALNSDEIDQVIHSDQSFEELYKEWKKNNEVKKQKRNPIVAGITKRRAMVGNNYFCEWCKCQPEVSKSVNSHHIIELSKGGPDNIYNTVSICTNCHGYFHSEKVKPLDKYRLFMTTKDHIIQENPEYLPQFNELLNKTFTPEEQERFNEFYTYEWNYFNYNANKKMG